MKKERSHCCWGSSPVALPHPAVGQGAFRKPLYSPPWADPSILSLIHSKLCGSGIVCGARRKGYQYLSPCWALSKAPLARVPTGKVGLSGSHLKAQESMLSLPMLKPRRVTGNFFSSIPSTFHPTSNEGGRGTKKWLPGVMIPLLKPCSQTTLIRPRNKI